MSDRKALMLQHICTSILSHYNLEYTEKNADNLENIFSKLSLFDLRQLEYLLETYFPHVQRLQEKEQNLTEVLNKTISESKMNMDSYYE